MEELRQSCHRRRSAAARPGATHPSHKTTIRLILGARESSENSGPVSERRADREGLGLGLVRGSSHSQIPAEEEKTDEWNASLRRTCFSVLVRAGDK